MPLSPDGTSHVDGETLVVPNSNGTLPPGVVMPPGATDCHHHIFDPRFPTKDGRPPATVADYNLLKRRLGLSRSVIVCPGAYGDDNACLLDALDQFGDAARGVVKLGPDVSDRSLDEYHARGVRGIRIYLHKNPFAPERIRQLAARLADMGWHMEIQPHVVARLIEAEQMLAGLPCRVVIDHMGYIPQPDGVNHAGFSTMMRLLELSHVWVKLSGFYYTSVTGQPYFEDQAEVATRLAEAAPDRTVWGTDWPHSGEVNRPNEAILIEQLALWAGSADRLRAILADNPDRLYWTN